MGVLKDFFNLCKGMTITGKYLGRHAVTIQYPEEKWTMPERSRGVVVLLSDKETGDLNCTMCMLCMRVCPTAAIQIDAPRDENKKRQLKKFEVNNSLCCYCGLCQEVCNFCAIKMGTMYEFSTYDKDVLIWDAAKLQEMGRGVDYVDTRKKKKPKPAPADKPADASAKTADKPAPADKPASAEDKPAEADKPKTADTPANPGETPPAKTEPADGEQKGEA